MQKKLIALAVAGFVAAPAFAQSNVTIYGVADVGIASGNYGNGNRTQVQSGQQSGSRLGFKGEEALGNGLKAVFQLEQGIAMDNGTYTQGGTPFGRQAFAGLSGNFGSITLGRQYSPHFLVLANADTFGWGLNGQNANAMALVPGVAARLNNSAIYMTPNFNGFVAALGYSSALGGNVGQEANTAANDKAGRTWGALGQYTGGPVWVAASYHNVVGATNDVKTKGWALGGTYDFKVAKLFAAYVTGKTDSAVGLLDKKNSWSLGVAVPFGPHTVSAQYTGLKDKDTSNANGRLFGIGYEYAFSKRTNLYASYAKAYNDSALVGGSAINLGGASTGNDLVTSSAGYDPSSIMVGVRHKF